MLKICQLLLKSPKSNHGLSKTGASWTNLKEEGTLSEFKRDERNSRQMDGQTDGQADRHFLVRDGVQG